MGRLMRSGKENSTNHEKRKEKVFDEQKESFLFIQDTTHFETNRDKKMKKKEKTSRIKSQGRV